MASRRTPKKRKLVKASEVAPKRSKPAAVQSRYATGLSLGNTRTSLSFSFFLSPFFFELKSFPCFTVRALRGGGGRGAGLLGSEEKDEHSTCPHRSPTSSRRKAGRVGASGEREIVIVSHEGHLRRVGALGGGPESKSGAGDKPTEAQSFSFEVNKEGELPIEAPVEDLPEQISRSLYWSSSPQF